MFASDADNSADFLPLMLCECIPSGREGPSGRAPSPSAGICFCISKRRINSYSTLHAPCVEPNRIAGFRRRSIQHLTRAVQSSVMRCAFFRLYTHQNGGGKDGLYTAHIFVMSNAILPTVLSRMNSARNIRWLCGVIVRR